jgi:hypothetical protein
MKSQASTSAEVIARRQVWLVAAIFVCLSTILVLSSAFARPDRRLADPIRVQIILPEGTATIAGGEGDWARQLEFMMPSAVIGRAPVVVQIGRREFRFEAQEFVQQWTIGPEQRGLNGTPIRLVSAPPSVSAPASMIPWVEPAINWPGDMEMIRQSFPAFLIIALAMSILAVLILSDPRYKTLSDRFARGFLPPPAEAVPGAVSVATAPAAQKYKTWPWVVSGLGVLAAGIVIVETMQPYYFTQDDAYVSTPALINVCRSVFSGVFPEWNAYQLLGSPTSSLGYGMTLYPPTYIAYFLARFVCGNEYMVTEILAIMHLAGGYLATFWACRRVGLRPGLAMAGSLAVVLSGYSLIVGRGWGVSLPPLVWTPLLVVAMARLERGPVGWRWAVLTGLCITVFFYEGFTQFWGYAIGLMAIALLVLVVTRRVPLRRALWAVPAVLLGIGLSMPLFMNQTRFAADIVRPPPYGNGIEEGVAALFFPYPLTHAPFPDDWGNLYREYTTEMYYSGTLFVVVTFVALGALIVYRSRRDLVGRNVWILCAAVALLVALGKDGVLWPLSSHIPVVNKANNNPFRILPFFNLFAVLGGGLVLERWLASARRARAWELGLSATVAGLMLYSSFMSRPAFFIYGDRPYPQLDPEMQRLLGADDNPNPYRIFPFAPYVSDAPGYSRSLMHCLPSLYDVLSCEGYDPLTESKPEIVAVRARFATNPAEAARAYGVRWIVVSNLLKHPLTGPLPHMRFAKLGGFLEPLSRASIVKLSTPDVEIREIPYPDPMAFRESAPLEALPIRLSGAGADVDVSGLKAGGPVIVNFLCWPDMAATVDGRSAAVTPDSWHRISVNVPAGASSLKIRYQPPWTLGITYGAVILLVVAAMIAGLAMMDRRRLPANSGRKP